MTEKEFNNNWKIEKKGSEKVSDADKKLALYFKGKAHYLVSPTGVVKKFGYDESGSYKEKIIYYSAPREKKPQYPF